MLHTDLRNDVFPYTQEEHLPCPVSCAIHPWMRGFVLLRSNPYMAVTDANGRFRIENLPAGEHVFQLWHERIGYLRNQPIGSLVANSRGRLTIDVREGNNELPESSLKVDAK